MEWEMEEMKETGTETKDNDEDDEDRRERQDRSRSYINFKQFAIRNLGGANIKKTRNPFRLWSLPPIPPTKNGIRKWREAEGGAGRTL